MTLRRAGGPLLHMDVTQILVPMFPPNYTLVLSAGPLRQDSAQIVYELKMGHNMVPGSFQGSVVLSGQTVITGIWNSAALSGEGSGFQWVTWAEPATLTMTNISGIYQDFEFDYASIGIPSENDYNTVLDWLNHVSTSHEIEDIARKTSATTEEVRDYVRMLTQNAPRGG